MMQPLLSLAIFHSWFAGGRFNGCQVMPDANTLRLLERYQLTQHSRDNVFTLYANATVDLTALLSGLQAQLFGKPLRFLLRFRPHEFMAMTQLPMNWTGTVSFDSRRTLPDQEYTGLLPELIDAGSAMAAPVTAGDGEFIDAVIGQLLVYPEDLMHSLPARYATHFAARQLHWVYYLYNRSQLRLNKPAISDLQGMVFEEPQCQTMPGGEQALCISSGDLAFPLQQVPTRFFHLIDRVAAGLPAHSPLLNRCVIKGLPVPQVGQISMKVQGGKPYVFSAMHIYV